MDDDLKDFVTQVTGLPREVLDKYPYELALFGTLFIPEEGFKLAQQAMQANAVLPTV